MCMCIGQQYLICQLPQTRYLVFLMTHTQTHKHSNMLSAAPLTNDGDHVSKHVTLAHIVKRSLLIKGAFSSEGNRQTSHPLTRW